jgi:hypothetical protein
MSSGQPLAAGVSVGPGESFNREDRMIEYCICSGEDIDTGPWVGVQNEYMGYEFAIKGSVHFGWARLSVTEHGVATLYRLRLRDGSPQAHCDRKYGRRRRRRFSRIGRNQLLRCRRLPDWASWRWARQEERRAKFSGNAAGRLCTGPWCPVFFVLEEQLKEEHLKIKIAGTVFCSGQLRMTPVSEQLLLLVIFSCFCKV